MSGVASALVDAAPPRGRPDWASDWGRDGFGHYLAFTVGEVTQRMRWIPPGRFLMGSPETEFGRAASEGPRHEVTIALGFWLFDTPCTQALWHAVMDGGPKTLPGPSQPAARVSFDMVRLFMDRANTLLPGLDLVLPSEAQWEYACRAGTETATYAGDWPSDTGEQARRIDSIAWYEGNAKGQTQPVAQKQPNAWGLHDMLGNVLEWCADRWHGDYAGAPSDGSAWLAGGAASRVLRGGSWLNVARLVRSACRSELNTSFKFDNVGFRCARGQPGQTAGGARAAAVPAGGASQPQRPAPPPLPAPAPATKPAARPAPPPVPAVSKAEPPAPAAAGRWYVSYAWGDKTPEGQARDEIVDRICAAAQVRGITILRDKSVLGTGESISKFMRRIGEGHRIFVILSEKYLRSDFCMFELHQIWRNSRDDEDTFRDRIRVFVLPDTPLDRPADWIKWGGHWKKEYQELEALVNEQGLQAVGRRAFDRLKQMQAFYTDVPDILGTLADMVQPRTFEELERYGFDDPAGG